MKAIVYVLALTALALVGGCDATKSPVTPPISMPAASDASASSAAPTARLGVAFRNGSFEVTVTRVAADVHELPLDETAMSGGLKPYQPENGLFVLVYVTARNVGNQPASMSATDSTLTDDRGKTFRCSGPYLGGVVGQDLSEEQQPDTVRSGFIVFDVPPSIGRPVTVTVQSDAYMGTTNPVTVVDVAG